MAQIFGEDAIEYAERNDRHVFLPPDQAYTPAEAKALPPEERARVFLALAYSGYVITDREEYLLQRHADNIYGFELTDGKEVWPGGIGKAAKVMPIHKSQVPLIHHED